MTPRCLLGTCSLLPLPPSSLSSPHGCTPWHRHAHRQLQLECQLLAGGPTHRVSDIRVTALGHAPLIPYHPCSSPPHYSLPVL